MTEATVMGLRQIKDAIRMLHMSDMRNEHRTKIGDDPKNLDAALVLIEEVCKVIRIQEGIQPTAELIDIACVSKRMGKELKED
jgi:molybdopterin-biosynthesis enzyme MoeA-like protein